jgi:hypothetical protein
LCGVGTVFNQNALVCDHWFNYDCGSAEKQYEASNKALLYDSNGNFRF